MRHLFSLKGRKVLSRYAASRVVVALDFDGTLAPIVDDPARAVIRSGTRVLLRHVTARYPCAVISGRGRRDVLVLVKGTGVSCVVGNHGLEWPGDHAGSSRVRGQVRRMARALKAVLAALPGVVLENKGYSIAVHYRGSKNKDATRVAIRAAVAALGACRITGGKYVINVLPIGDHHKGTALARIMEECGCDTAIYVGDDVTDEEAFAAARGAEVLTVRVGYCRASRAEYCLRSQREIDRFLALLAGLRPRAS